MFKIRPKQHSFRPNHSTSTQLLNLIDELITCANERTFTAVVSLGVGKAFDKVQHVGFIYKVIEMKTPTQLVNIIKSFLTSRTFQTKINKTFSSSKKASHQALVYPLTFLRFLSTTCSNIPNRKLPCLQTTHYFTQQATTTIKQSIDYNPK